HLSLAASPRDSPPTSIHTLSLHDALPIYRRLAMSLLGMRPVNPGGDGFAAWLGTQGHRGMADIYEWADGRSGRFAVETPLNFPRSEEHTSELQSRENLVCRLLLEKKKKY